jgi:hypothetical protein
MGGSLLELLGELSVPRGAVADVHSLHRLLLQTATAADKALKTSETGNIS